MFKNNPLRDLARSDYWQNAYRVSKEMNIDLFLNKSDLSKIQIIFLSYLNLYDSITSDIVSNMLDGAEMSIERMNSDFLVDCYIVYKRRKSTNKKDKPEKKKNLSGIPSISFVSKRRK